MHRTHLACGLPLLVSAFSALAAATPAAATSVIGFGDPAFGNACTNHGDPRAGGGTTRHSGTAAGLGVVLPVGSPGNQCGTLGLPTSLHEAGGIDVIGTLTGGEV
ncbi:hypothetical protein [Streptomyces sp. NPDC013455]|uniref:hypothetical protein n=1 Tax=Streptomyces sp. NPDC013455 TaxID=3155605 RepID=UPI0033C6538E